MKKEIAIVENELMFDYTNFLAEITSAESLSAKVKIFNKAMNQEAILKKNMNDQLRKNGGRTSKSTDYDYIPIEIVEEGLRQIFFRQIDFTIQNSYRDLNSFIVISRITYLDPITNQYRKIDGIGAQALQQDSGSQLQDFNSTMKKNALELGVGIAYSRSIKNAAKKLGKAFGASLNRDEEISSISVFKRQSEDEVLLSLQTLFIKKAHLVQKEGIQRIREIIETKETASYSKALKELKEL